MYNESSIIWDSVWKEDKYSSKNLRKHKAKIKTDVLLKHISPQSNWKIVDLGCGGGYVTEEIYSRIKCSIIGVDFSGEAIKLCENRLGHLPIKFIKSNVCNTNIQNEYADLVICCGIIEHIKEPEKLFNEIYRILKPNGYIFVTTSNLVSTIWPQRLIKQWLRRWSYGYQKNWTKNGISKLLENQNFNVLHTEMITDSGDYKLLGFFDRMILMVYKYAGRYIVLWGRKRNV